MKKAQEKLWDAVDYSPDAEIALPLLREALEEGANLECVNTEGHDPLRAAVDVCCHGKAPFARELALRGCNPLNDALEWVIQEEDYEIAEALIEVAVQKNYRNDRGQGVLEVILGSTPILGSGDLVRHALNLGAVTAAADGKGLFAVLIENPEAFNTDPDQITNLQLGQNQVAWTLLGVLLDAGFTPTAVDAQGRDLMDLINDGALQGSQDPRNQELIARFVDISLQQGTDHPDSPSSRQPRM